MENKGKVIQTIQNILYLTRNLMQFRNRKLYLAKLTIRSFFRNTKQIQNYMNFLALDMQLATKFVGVYMQVLDYLGDNQSVQLISARYQYVLKDFFTKGIGKKNISADEILQMNYPYTESNRFC